MVVRFLRSKLWSDYLKKQDKRFLSKFAVSKASLVYDYKNEDFGQEAIVTDADFQFAALLTQDDYDWELQQHTKWDHGHISAYFSHRNYMPKVDWAKNGSVCKFVGTFPFPFEFVVNALCSMNSIASYENYVKSVQNVDFLSNVEARKKYPLQVQQTHRAIGFSEVLIQFPFPCNQIRRSSQTVSALYDPTARRFTYIQKSRASKTEATSKSIIDMHIFTVFQFTELDKNRTMFHQVVIFNMHGWSSPAVNKMTVGIRAKQAAQTLLHFLQQDFQGKHANLQRNDVLAQCLQACQISSR